MLRLTSSENVSRRWKKLLMPLLRVVLPTRARSYYFGHPALRGQLWFSERKLISEAVLARRPRMCFEIGTWYGGGSTYFIAKSLLEIGQGVLHTVEIDKNIFTTVVRNYSTYLPDLCGVVVFHIGNYVEEFTNVLADGHPVDLVFLDGAENGKATYEQFRYFAPYLRPGSALLVHDWYTEKARYVKAELEGSSDWRLDRVLNPPESVGLALWTRVVSGS